MHRTPTQKSRARLHWHAALGIIALLGAAGLVTPAQAADVPRALLVIRQGGPSQPTDDKIRDHLQGLGLAVTEIDQATPTKQACSYDLVVLSSSVRSRDLGGAYRDVTVPLLTWENDLLDDLRFTGRKKDADFGLVEKEHYLWMVNAPHPLSAGQPAGNLVAYQKDAPMGWGRPGLGASIIATIPGEPDKATVFGYERGATMDYDFLAPARRIFVFLDNDTFGNLTPAGLSLFDAAVRWGLADPGRRDAACKS
ncbi:MAG TPA: hypothetical protein VN229_07270 [Terriglobales bacterium]|nr:hypothetical protein [Terriglobales bacterium]